MDAPLWVAFCLFLLGLLAGLICSSRLPSTIRAVISTPACPKDTAHTQDTILSRAYLLRLIALRIFFLASNSQKLQSVWSDSTNQHVGRSPLQYVVLAIPILTPWVANLVGMAWPLLHYRSFEKCSNIANTSVFGASLASLLMQASGLWKYGAADFKLELIVQGLALVVHQDGLQAYVVQLCLLAAATGWAHYLQMPAAELDLQHEVVVFILIVILLLVVHNLHLFLGPLKYTTSTQPISHELQALLAFVSTKRSNFLHKFSAAFNYRQPKTTWRSTLRSMLPLTVSLGLQLLSLVAVIRNTGSNSQLNLMQPYALYVAKPLPTVAALLHGCWNGGCSKSVQCYAIGVNVALEVWSMLSEGAGTTEVIAAWQAMLMLAVLTSELLQYAAMSAMVAALFMVMMRIKEQHTSVANGSSQPGMRPEFLCVAAMSCMLFWKLLYAPKQKHDKKLIMRRRSWQEFPVDLCQARLPPLKDTEAYKINPRQQQQQQQQDCSEPLVPLPKIQSNAQCTVQSAQDAPPVLLYEPEAMLYAEHTSTDSSSLLGADPKLLPPLFKAGFPPSVDSATSFICNTSGSTSSGTTTTTTGSISPRKPTQQIFQAMSASTGNISDLLWRDRIVAMEFLLIGVPVIVRDIQSESFKLKSLTEQIITVLPPTACLLLQVIPFTFFPAWHYSTRRTLRWSITVTVTTLCRRILHLAKGSPVHLSPIPAIISISNMMGLLDLNGRHFAYTLPHQLIIYYSIHAYSNWGKRSVMCLLFDAVEINVAVILAYILSVLLVRLGPYYARRMTIRGGGRCSNPLHQLVCFLFGSVTRCALLGAAAGIEVSKLVAGRLMQGKPLIIPHSVEAFITRGLQHLTQTWASGLVDSNLHDLQLVAGLLIFGVLSLAAAQLALAAMAYTHDPGSRRLNAQLASVAAIAGLQLQQGSLDDVLDGIHTLTAETFEGCGLYVVSSAGMLEGEVGVHVLHETPTVKRWPASAVQLSDWPSLKKAMEDQVALMSNNYPEAGQQIVQDRFWHSPRAAAVSPSGLSSCLEGQSSGIGCSSSAGRTLSAGVVSRNSFDTRTPQHSDPQGGVGSGLHARVVAGCEANFSDWDFWHDELGANSIMVTPLAFAREEVGALVLLSAVPNILDPGFCGLVMEVAAQVAQALYIRFAVEEVVAGDRVIQDIMPKDVADQLKRRFREEAQMASAIATAESGSGELMPRCRSEAIPLTSEKQVDVAKLEQSGTADALVAAGVVYRQWHPNVSVLFADIVGYTAISQELEPEQVMLLLHELFCKYDLQCSAHNVYKVETIGDCYMACTGVLEEAPNHAASLVEFGKAMLEAAASVRNPLTNSQVRIRVGIHSGRVMSGIVGYHRARYCLFGDTVNTASRMESTGVPDTIQISEHTYNLLGNTALEEQLEFRGSIEVKGKGIMKTYLLKPEHATPAPTYAAGTSAVAADP